MPSPPPSSGLSPAVPHEWPLAGARGTNMGRGSRSFTDLTARLTVRAGDRHAPPLSSSGKVFSLTFILLSALVRFEEGNPIILSSKKISFQLFSSLFFLLLLNFSMLFLLFPVIFLV